MGDIVDTGSFKTLFSTVQVAGIVETLKGAQGPFTVFAPDDEVFGNFPKAQQIPY